MEIRLEYRLENGKEVAPTFGIQITNMGTQTIYCGLLDLTQRHGVFAELFRTGCVKLEPNQTAHACDGRPIPATVPDEVWRQGAVEYKDLLKLIVCTREFDARLLRQPNLDMPGTRGLSGTRSGALGSSLNRLLAKVQTRELGNDSGITEIADWQAMDVSFTTVRPHLTAALPDAGKSVVLVGGVTVEGHRSLKAQARLMSTPLSTRDLNGLRLPHQFYDAPDLTSPLNFTPARGFDPGLSVLDLTDVSNIEAVTAESPLRLSVPAALAWNEHVIPIAYDGRFFIPLGRIEKRTEQNTVIAIDRLPPPLADGRSLTGAIKIFFQKIVSRVDGLDFPFPRLAAIDVSTEVIGPTVTAPSQVGQRVAGAQRIGLFIHGIIGSTDTMVPGLQLGKFADGRTLVGLYDVVLTFDYENLNTPIEENARLLKAKLEAVGLGAGHGKKLDIIAHSMGGLVSRWFIEHEGGQEIVSRLIMLGTPNGGSPWPKVVDWATVTLGIGLNQMGAIPWTTALLGWLSRLIESPTVTLEQMQSGSELLGQLKASADLGIPYYLIAGNTSIIPAASQGDDAENTSALGCLLKRLTSPDLLHHVANPFFFGHPNDIAVSIASMEDIATGWRLRDIFVAACDHLSYFQAPAGLVAFAQVLAKVD
jgi:pimeloyl-ACP methyl ester carboxylesterase